MSPLFPVLSWRRCIRASLVARSTSRKMTRSGLGRPSFTYSRSYSQSKKRGCSSGGSLAPWCTALEVVYLSDSTTPPD